MFKKPKRNFRSRRRDSESGPEDNADINTGNGDGDNGAGDVGSVLDTVKTGGQLRKDKPGKGKTEAAVHKVSSGTSLSVLSFNTDDGDDAEETFQIKKSNYSRKIARQLKKAHRQEKNVDKSAVCDHESDDETDSKDAPVDDVNGVGEMPIELTESDIRDLDDVAQTEEDSGDRLAPSVQNILSGGQIPDAAMIHMIRKKRQMARETVDEYVPLDNKSSGKPASRLVREEEHDKSDDDERIEFSVNSREEELRVIQNTILAAEEGSHSEGSDHENEWERQQIRKGTGVATSVPADSDYTTNEQGGQLETTSSSIFNVQTYTPINYCSENSDETPCSRNQLTTAIIRKALKQRYEKMLSVHQAHVHERDEVTSRISASNECIATIQASSKRTENGAKSEVEQRYCFFQEMRAYVRDLIDCFNDKMPAIDHIDNALMNIRRQQAELLATRLQEDIKDQSEQFISGKGTVAPILNEDPVKQRRVAEREARRFRRRRAREAKYVTDYMEGWSTDDEQSYSQSTKFKTDRESLLRDAEHLMADVVDEFSDLSAVSAKLQQWKEQYPQSYNDAYISLCLPKLFSPLIRLSLVDWNPAEATCKPFEEMQWYQSLLFYGHKEGGTALEQDADIRLMPSIIEKVLLPKLTELIEGVWNPLSSQQVKRFVEVVTGLIQHYPTVSSDSKNTQALIRAIVQRIRKCLDNDVFIPLYPKQILENRMCGASVFFHRQFSSCVKLLCNILQWKDVLSMRTQQELALDSLLNRYLLLACHSAPISADNINKCTRISNSFPAEWFSELKGETTIDKLSAFCKFLVTAANVLNNSAASNNDMDKKDARVLIKQITKLLVKVNAIDSALSLASLYSLKISRPETEQR